MGVETDPLVVRGFYFTEKDLNDLSIEEIEDILENENVVSVSPMVSTDFIFGDLLSELGEEPVRLEDFSPNDEKTVFQKLPDGLKERAKNFGTYCFICYH